VVGNYSLYDGLAKSLTRNVRFTGHLSGDLLKNEFFSHHVFVSPSFSDGFSNAVGEAISYGLPVILTNNVGFSDLIVNNFNGLVVGVNDVKMLEQAMEWFLENRFNYANYSKEAFNLANLYSWDNYVDSVVKELINQSALWFLA
jgi:glycosyltransferase involved in cell wall biosynthesis